MASHQRALIGALNGRNGTALNRRIDIMLGMLGLEGRQNDLLESYSSGMKQKVLVASTLLSEPKLVFLDEPTARLDPAASALVKDLILALARELNNRGLKHSSTYFSASSEAKDSIIIFLKSIFSCDIDMIKAAMFTPFFPINLRDAFEMTKTKDLNIFSDPHNTLPWCLLS